MKLLESVKRYPCAFLFGILLIAITVFDVLSPDKEISELENRALKQPPAFKLEALVENRWTRDYGEYVREQFVMRDGWLGMHAVLEQSMQKLELGGVWMGRDGYLMAKTPYDGASVHPVLMANTGAICSFAKKHPGRVYVMLVPSASNVLSDHLRFDPPRMDENAAMDEVYERLNEAGINTIDLRELFGEAAAMGEQVYYRTDHHWTTDGGTWLAYEAFCNAAGREAIKPAETLLSHIDGFLGTNHSKALNAGATPDRLYYYDFPNMISIERYAPDGSAFMQEETLMAKEKLLSRDKYGAFLHGINGYTHIDGGGRGSIVIVKDSFGNCFAPFLMANYGNIEAIDLRGRQSIDDIVETGSDILILYSFAMFSQDVDMFWLS